MVGRFTAAAAVYLLTVDGLTTPARLRIALSRPFSGVVVAVMAVLEYWHVDPVLRLLRAFRPGVSGVGAQIRATSGTLQYPTIASMYLEVVFAFALGLLLSAVDAPRGSRAGWFVALLLVADAIVLTFTRAGLITIAFSVAMVGAAPSGHKVWNWAAVPRRALRRCRHARHHITLGTVAVAPTDDREPG